MKKTIGFILVSSPFWITLLGVLYHYGPIFFALVLVGLALFLSAFFVGAGLLLDD